LQGWPRGSGSLYRHAQLTPRLTSTKSPHPFFMASSQPSVILSASSVLCSTAEEASKCGRKS
jgi:hypothetical protein